MGDLFRDQLEASYSMLSKGAEARYDREAFSSLSAKMSVPEHRKFVGWDAYKSVIDACDVIVIGHGEVRFQGTLDELVTASGESDLEDAFIRMAGVEE